MDFCNETYVGLSMFFCLSERHRARLDRFWMQYAKGGLELTVWA